mgnify:CR=1 FL=1
MKFIEDKEIDLNNNDILKTKVYADNLVKVINNSPNNKVFTIGLFGGWGVGKSSIIKTAQQEIEGKDKKIKFITYDAWKYANDSFRRMFLLKVQQELGHEQTEEMQRFYQSESAEIEPKVRISTNGLLTLVVILLLITFLILQTNWDTDWKIGLSALISFIGLFITIKNGIFQQLKIQINKPIIFAPEQFESCFKELISKSLKRESFVQRFTHTITDYVKKGNKSVTDLDKVVIVVDNIDRCHNSMAYQLLTDIKTFLSDEEYNVVFIIPVDDEALKQNLFANHKSSHECNKEKEEFLRKFFNVTLRIKPHLVTELNTYAKGINAKYELGFNDDTIALCSKEFAKNPRRIIQLFNNLTSELSLYPSEFVQRNESLICAMLILKEEYSDYYYSVVNDVNLLKDYESYKAKVKNEHKELDELSSFMRISSLLFRLAKKQDLLQILTNSEAVFEMIPTEIKNALSSYDLSKIIEYTEINGENRKLILDLIKRNVEEDIKSKSGIQITNSLELVVGLMPLLDISNSILKEIDILYTEWYPTILSKINKSSHLNLCRFAAHLDSLEQHTLKERIINYITNVNFEEDDYTFDASFTEAVLTVFSSVEDCERLSSFVSKLFDVTNNYFANYKYTEEQLNILFTDDLIKTQIEKITLNNNVETDKLLWLLQHKSNIKTADYYALLNRISILIGSTTNKNKAQILTFIQTTLAYIRLIPNCRIIEIDNLASLNNKIMQRNVNGRSVSILDECKNENENLHTVLDCLMNIYRISNGVITVDQIEKSVLYDKDYVYSHLIEFKNECFTLEPFATIIISDNNYSDERVIIFVEHFMTLRNNNGTIVLPQDAIKNKIKSLLDNIDNIAVVAMIERLVNDILSKEYIINDITNRNLEYINALPKSLLELAIDCFNQETASSFVNNMSFLTVVATKGTTEQKKELVKVLTDNINKKNRLKETFTILETIELEKTYNKQMLCSALQSYKDGVTNVDERVDFLITKFNENIK